MRRGKFVCRFIFEYFSVPRVKRHKPALSGDGPMDPRPSRPVLRRILGDERVSVLFPYLCLIQ